LGRPAGLTSGKPNLGVAVTGQGEINKVPVSGRMPTGQVRVRVCRILFGSVVRCRLRRVCRVPEESIEPLAAVAVRGRDRVEALLKLVGLPDPDEHA